MAAIDETGELGRRAEAGDLDLTAISGTLARRSQEIGDNAQAFRQAIERTFLVEGGERITAEGLTRAESLTPERPPTTPEAGGTLEQMEERMIREALRRLDGNLSRVSRELGITRSSLYRRLDKYGIPH